LSVNPRSIKDDVERMLARKIREGRRAEEKHIKETTAGFSDKVNLDYVKAPAIAKNEENVLGLLLLYPEKRKIVFEDKLLSAVDFYTEFNKRVFSFIESAYHSNDDSFEGLNESFSPEEVGRIMKMKINRMALSSFDDAVIYDSIDALKRSVRKKEAIKTNTFEGLDAILKRKRDD
jgi:hypothetical protein